MTIHRFFIQHITDEQELKTGDQFVFPSEVSHQIRKVLHLQAGDEVIVFDGSGQEWLIRLNNRTIEQSNNLNRMLLTGNILEKRNNLNEPIVFLTLYQALLPREKFEDILEKTTEIGVSTFVPIEMQRSIVRVKDVDEKKILRWEKIIQEAAEQSERGRVPKMLPAMKFGEALQKASQEGSIFVALERMTDTVILSGTKNISFTDGQDDKKVSLFIGPEGGFTDEEKELIKKYHATPISLGSRILRSETAAIVASALFLLS